MKDPSSGNQPPSNFILQSASEKQDEQDPHRKDTGLFLPWGKNTRTIS